MPHNFWSIIMSLDSFSENPCSETTVQGDLLDNPSSQLDISLQDFVSEFGDEQIGRAHV